MPIEIMVVKVLQISHRKLEKITSYFIGWFCLPSCKVSLSWILSTKPNSFCAHWRFWILNWIFVARVAIPCGLRLLVLSLHLRLTDKRIAIKKKNLNKRLMIIALINYYYYYIPRTVLHIHCSQFMVHLYVSDIWSTIICNEGMLCILFGFDDKK